MKATYTNRIFNFWIGLFLFLSLILFEIKLHINGAGVEKENELTFGFFDFVGLEKVAFYEINSFFFCILIAALIFLFSKIKRRQSSFFHVFYLLTCSSFFMVIYTFIFNLNNFATVNYTLNYSDRFFAILDDLIESKHLIYIQFNEVNYQVVFYGMLIFLISFVVLIINSFFPIQIKSLEEIDHLVEKN